MMTPTARKALEAVLGSAPAQGGVTQELTLLQTGDQQPNTMPVMKEPNPEGQWKKCAVGEATCSLLHDTMSLEWGKFRDSFDELAAQMKANKDEYEETIKNLNGQLSVISEANTRYMTLLASTISSSDSVYE